MSYDEKLYQTAFSQGGLFTSKQAVGCGFSQKNHAYYVRTDRWQKESRGIYRMAMITPDETTYYWRIILWTRDRNDEPQAVLSHETALALHDLSDVNPAEVTITVPLSFRRNSSPPTDIAIHKAHLESKDVHLHRGLPVTTPLRTLQDIVNEGSLSEDLIDQAVREALDKGFISRTQLKTQPELARHAL